MLNPFFTYYGGKWRIAKKLYPAPSKDTIIEPFAGSAGYSLRYPHKNVILYDINPVIFGVWDYLIKVSSEEIVSLPTQFDSVDDLQVPQEAKWLIGFWLNKGTAMPCKKPSAWMRSGKRGKSFWSEDVKSRISTQLYFIRHWKVYNSSYENIDNTQATWFIDPPYNNTAGSCYKFHNIDYINLGEWCKNRNGQIIVCENDVANWLPFTELATIKGNAGKMRSGVSKEVVFLAHNDL